MLTSQFATRSYFGERSRSTHYSLLSLHRASAAMSAAQSIASGSAGLYGDDPLGRGSSEERVGAGAEDEEMPATTCMCFLCEKFDDIQQLPHCIYGRLFHSACHAAVRSYRRTLNSDSVSQTQYKHTFHHNHEQWRKLVLPFLPSGRESRDVAREQAHTWHQIERREQVDVDEQLNDKMVLTRIQFQVWTAIWEKLSAKDADTKFDALSIEQKGTHDVGTEKYVAYQGIKRLRERSGVERRSGIESVNAITEEEFNAKHKRIRTKSPAPQSFHSMRPSVADSSKSKTVSEPSAEPGSQQGRGTPRGKQGLKKSASMEELRWSAPSSLNATQFMQRQELMTEDIDAAIKTIVGNKKRFSGKDQ